jgi:hypothetical protein
MKIVGIFCLILAGKGLIAQEYPRKEIDISRIAEELSEVPDEDLNYEDLYENLLQLTAHPLDLNKASAEELRFIKVLTDSQVNDLLRYRTENGSFISIYELQAVPGFDLQTIYKLVPFVIVKDPSSVLNTSMLHKIRDESDNYFLLRYERTAQPKKGFSTDSEPETKFKGSPDKLYLRFRSSSPGEFSFGFTMEKDAGEQLQWNPSKRYYGVDYLSYHFQIQNKGRIKNLIVGDYQSQFGQGLMLGGIFGMGKGSETITTVRRNNIGLLPYTSAYEGGSLRGAALAIQGTNRIYVTGFYSHTNKDATVGSDHDKDIISSFQNSGYHRNENELGTRKVIGEKNLGGVVQYKADSLEVGAMYNQTMFDVPVQRSVSAYNQFAFRGISNRNVGLYLNYRFQNATFFSELSHSIGAGYAGTAGLLASLTSKFDLSILYRKFDRNFYAFYSNGFGEGSNTQNETGVYWGWKYSFNRKFGLSGYTDLFKFPWLKFRNYAPSLGYEWLVRFNFEPTRKVKLFIQARQESKTRNVETDDINLYKTSIGLKTNYWLHIDCSPHQMLRLKSRLQFSTFSVQDRVTQGVALMQDLIVDLGKLKLTVRYALFETDDYDNRQYSYENDVWLAYSMPAYSGVGVRKMAMIEYKLNNHMSFWIRYARIRYNKQEEIGTGVDQIKGVEKDDIKVQLLVRI